MTILSIIFMNNGVIEKMVLFDQLKRLGLREQQPHPLFGDWEKLIDRFVKELYLEKKRKKNNEGIIFEEFRAGPRAAVETEKKDVLKFVSTVYGEEVVDAQMLKELELEEEESENSSSEEELPSQASQASQASQNGGASKRGGRGRGRGK